MRDRNGRRQCHDGHMELVERFENAAAVAAEVVGRISVGELRLPTPCTEWNVAEVADHLVGGVANLAARLRGEEPKEEAFGPDFRADLGEAVAETRAAFALPGVFERLVDTPFGEQPAPMLIDLRTAELLVHSWDLAAATGQSTDFAPELSEQCLAQWRGLLGDGPRPEPSPIGQPLQAPPEATPADRLAAFFGRST